jgi:hypothetical protein
VAVGRQNYIDREFSAVGSATTRAEASSPGLLTCLMCVFCNCLAVCRSVFTLEIISVAVITTR